MEIRDKLIETAYQIFYEQGFHASGVELLAKQANTTKRTLYAHFGNKNGLISAVLDYRHQQFFNKMTSALERLPESYTVTAYLDFIANWTQSKGFYGCLFINASAEFSDKTGFVQQKVRSHKEEIRQVLKTRLAKGGVDNADIVADMLFVFGEGLITAAQTGQNDINKSRLEIEKLLLNYMNK